MDTDFTMSSGTVAIVLQQKGVFYNGRRRVEYDVGDVRWLAKMIQAHTSPGTRLACLSDVAIDAPGVDHIPLVHGWPGWWSKMELFRPNLFTGPVLYIDLDTVIINNIDNFVSLPQDGAFYMLRNFTHGRIDKQACGSGVMAWSGDYSHLYREFLRDPDKHMTEYRTPLRWGDQGFIGEHQRSKKFLQDAYPGEIISYKVDYLHGKESIDGVKIVCFHGRPKPKAIQQPWVPPYC